LLPSVEQQAATRFASLDTVAWLADAPVISESRHRAYLGAGGPCFVAESERGELLGFIVTSLIERDIFIEETSVLPRFSGRGIGSQLLRAVIGAGHRADCAAVSLTTYRDIPWNGPWYERCGFRVLEPEACPDYLRQKLSDEARAGLSPPLRVAMVFDVRRGPFRSRTRK
jgi:GNAT superfamily N-acetyltransferase